MFEEDMMVVYEKMVIALLLQQWLFYVLWWLHYKHQFSSWWMLHVFERFADRFLRPGKIVCFMLRHKLACCIATLRTWIVIHVCWPFQRAISKDELLHPAVMIMHCLGPKKKKEFSHFLTLCFYCLQKRAVFSQYCAPVVTVVYGSFPFPVSCQHWPW